MSQKRFKAIMNLLMMVTLLTTAATTALAQTSRNHELIRTDLAPGTAAHFKLMGNRELVNHIQPVRVACPDGTRLSIVANNSFMEMGSSAQTVGCRVGPLYRFRVSGFQNSAETELYPSIELLDRLHPPAGLENKFPIIVAITSNDLEHAAAGKLVTKVIYVEDSETALPRQNLDNEQPYFDVSSAEDPLRTAEGLGRPMAILRIGSRIPTGDELINVAMSPFKSETPTMLPQDASFIENGVFEVEIPGTATPILDSTSNVPDSRPLQPLKPPMMKVTNWQNLSDEKDNK